MRNWHLPIAICFLLILSTTLVHAEHRCGVERPFKQEIERTTANLNTDAFLEHVATALKGQFTGYAVIFTGAAGKRLGFRREGWAVDPCDDAPKRFDLNTETPIGSVTKLFVAVAVLKASSDPARLQRPLTDFLPFRWKAMADPFYKTVTVEMLLQHQGGFLKSGLGKHVSLRLRDGIERRRADYAAQPRFYSNSSFGIFHFIYARYGFRSTKFLNPKSLHDIEVQFQNKSMSDYNKAVQDVTSMALNHGLYKHILRPLKISATCDARISSFPPSSSIKVPPNAPIEHFDFFVVAKSYSGPTSGQGKFLPGTMRNCAAGGLYMSAKDLAKFVTALSDPQFLPPAQHRLLFSNGPARDVYAFDTRRILGDRAFWKDGGRNEFGVSSIAYVLRYPTGAHAVFVANSAGSTANVGVVLRDAYIKARGM